MFHLSCRAPRLIAGMFQLCQGLSVGRFLALVPPVFGIIDSVRQIRLTVFAQPGLF